MTETPETNKPDFSAGVPIRDLRDGSMIPGQADGEELVLVRRGDEFFTTVAINYVGHAEKWEAIEIDGSLDAGDCAVAYKKGGSTLAIVTISRDLQSLQAEAAMEAETQPQRQEVA